MSGIKSLVRKAAALFLALILLPTAFAPAIIPAESGLTLPSSVQEHADAPREDVEARPPEEPAEEPEPELPPVVEEEQQTVPGLADPPAQPDAEALPEPGEGALSEAGLPEPQPGEEAQAAWCVPVPDEAPDAGQAGEEDTEILFGADTPLGDLLEGLALQQGITGYEELVEWLLETAILDDADRQTIQEGLLEDSGRLPGLLTALQTLREQVEAEAAEAEPETVENQAAILAAAREMAGGTAAASGAVRASGPLVSATKTNLDDPWISWTDRQVGPALDEEGRELFRHYGVTAAFETAPVEDASGPVDIVLVIDNSKSMQYVLGAVKEAALAFLGQPEVAQSSSRVAVVSFSNDARLVSGLADPGDPALEAAIRGIAVGEQSNLQAGILMARQVWGMDDSSVYDAAETGRRRAVVLLTDGASNYRHTDLWRYRIGFEGQDTYTYLDAEPQTGPVPGAGQKRWSWADSLEVLPFSQSLYLDGARLNTHGIDYGNARLAKETARLEAQYLASQGVELYGISYGNGEYLGQLCQTMVTQPDFNTPIYTPPYDGAALSTAAEGQRVFDAADPQTPALLSEALFAVRQLEAPELTVTDQLESAFQLVEGSVYFSDAAGTVLPKAGEVRYADGRITWTLPAGLAAGSYAIHYTVRVKDDPAQPMRYYPDGAVEQAVSREAGIGYEGLQPGYYTFEECPVDVPPLLWITAADVAALAGEAVPLTGTVARGNGSYTYAWYDAAETRLDFGVVPLDGIDPTSGLGLSIPVPECAIRAEAGTSLYYLEVTDTWAWNNGAGYSGGRLRVPVELTAVEASLTIRVLGADGADIPGKFEVTIHKTEAGASGEQYHYLGLGEVTYGTATGLTQGSYEIGAYVPYGYRVTGQDKQSLVIAPVQREDGGWDACHETVTIEIAPTWPMYFFSWVWGE